MNICDPFQSCEARSLVDSHTQWQAWGSEAGVLTAQLFIYLILVFVDFNVINYSSKSTVYQVWLSVLSMGI